MGEPRDIALQVVTSQYFGQAYFGAPVWLTSNLQYSIWKRLESHHYRVICAAVRDFKRKIPKVMLEVISKRAPPRMWSNYVTAPTVMSLYNNSDTRLSEYLRESSYIYERRPKKAKLRDAAKRKIGRQALKNRLLHLNNINFDWIGPEVCKN